MTITHGNQAKIPLLSQASGGGGGVGVEICVELTSPG